MIAARTLKSKEALDDLTESGESIEDIEIAASNAEKALNSIGLTARKSNGDFKGLEEILGEVASKWGGLTDATKQYVSEQLAGNNRRSYFIGLMENYERVAELQKIAESSSGALFEASEKQAESLKGRINVLQNAWGNLHSTILTRDMAKDIVDFATTMVNALTGVVQFLDNNWATALATATGALVAFKMARDGLSFAGFVKELAMGVTSLMGFTGAVEASTLAIVGLKAAAGGILGLIIGGTITGLVHLSQHTQRMEESFDAISETASALSNQLSGLDSQSDVIDAYEKANKELANLTEGSDEYIAKQQEINMLQQEISQWGGEYLATLNDQNLAIEGQIQALKNLTGVEKQIAIQEAIDSVDQNAVNDQVDNFNTKMGTPTERMVQEYVNVKKEIEAKRKELSETTNAEVARQLKDELDVLKSEGADLQSVLMDVYKEVVKDMEDLSAYNDMLDEADAIGSLHDLERVKLDKPALEMFEALKKALGITPNLANDANEIADGFGKVSENASDAKDEIEGMADSASNLKQANKEYLNSIEDIAEAQELLESFKDGLDASELRTLFDSELMKDYNGALTDTVSIQDHLNAKIKEMEDASNEAYNNMLKNDTNYWNTKVKNSEEWAKYEQGLQDEMVRLSAEALGVQETDFRNYIQEKGGIREVDLSNAKTLAEAERTLNGNLNSQVLGFFASFINEKADARVDDMDNVVAFLKAQNLEEVTTIQQLAKLWNDYYNAKKKEISTTLTATKNAVSAINNAKPEMPKLNSMEQKVWNDMAKKMNNGNSGKNHYETLYNESMKTYEGNQKKVQELNNMLQQLEKDNNAFNGLLNGLKGYNASNSLKQDYVNADKGGFVGSSLNKPSSSSGSGSSGDKGSSTSEKEVDDLELEIDRYYELNDAIKDLENSLSSLQTKREQITTKDEYKKSVEEEIALVKKQITAYQNLLKEQQKERDEIKSTLGKNGFKFDSDGDISNYATQLKKLQDNANKKTGEAKEQAIAQVEALADLIDRYNELHNDAIPSTNVEIISLQTEIQNLNKDLEENMKAIEALGDRYFNLSRQMAKVDNAIALNQLLQEVAVGQRKLDLMKEEQELLKEKQRITKEQLAESKKESDELAKQLKDKGVTLNADGSIKNYNDLIKKLTEQADKLVGDAQSEAIEEAEDLLDLIDKYVTLTEDTIPELNQAWQEYANNIASIEEEMKQTAVDAQKDVASAYEHYLTKRYNKVKEMLQKEKDAYNDAYEEESFDRNLKKEQQALDEIAQQIAIYSRDTSEAGKARLEQLKKEYEEQQEAINDMIRENEKNLMNDRFDEEQEKLDEELEDLLSPENLVKAVNEAISSGMITLGDEVVSLNELMTNWIDETGDGLYALGDTIKKDLIGNLQMAKSVLDDMGFKGSVNVPSLASVLGEFKGGTTSNVSFNAPLLQVEGNVDKNVFADLQSEMKKLETSIINKIANSMK